MKALGEFAAAAAPPDEARARAAVAVLDTVGVALAGAAEPAARILRRTIASGAPEQPCTVFGSLRMTDAASAALANGTAAHALDFDDMCFVSLAHPSAPLVPALLAAAEYAGASGRTVLDAYVVAFEIEARLGMVMNPQHYQRGWHCTSTLGTIGAAAGASRVLGLEASTTANALAIAASGAAGLKENFGTMVKPLHAGLAAQHGVRAALLAQEGMAASDRALDGPQGFLRAMDSQRETLGDAAADLGRRWEIIDTGITVKLYPSCAATHPPLDAILDLRREARFDADDVAGVEVDVDRITPTVLLYERPATGLEAKFSLPFCAAAAVVHGAVGIETFDEAGLRDPLIAAFMPRVHMNVDASFDGHPPLTQARVHVHLRDGRALTRAADGARGYPANPPSAAELDAKFLSCARRALAGDRARDALAGFRAIGDARDIRELMSTLSMSG